MQQPCSLPALEPAPLSHPAHPAGIHLGYTPALEVWNLSSHWCQQPPWPLCTSMNCLTQHWLLSPHGQALPRQLPLPSSRCPSRSQRSMSFITRTQNMRRCLPHVRTNVSFTSTTAFITTFLQSSIQRPSFTVWLKAPTLVYSTGGT